nr:zinc finger protein 2 homolog [Parasteatoda tepidariorum]
MYLGGAPNSNSYNFRKHGSCHVCNICNRQFGRKSSLNRHYVIHTGERPYSCTECGKNFAQKDNLKTHLRSHTGERPFVCNFCPKRFSSKQHMLEHIVTLDGHKIRKSQRSALKIHFMTHTGERPHTCKECEFLLSDFIYPNLDLNSSSSSFGQQGSSFVCHVCERAFSKKALLKRHLPSHAEKKPYSCHHCVSFFSGSIHSISNSSFTSFFELSSHECDACGKVFPSKSSLKMHSFTHSGERPYSCKECGKGFTQKGNLIRHLGCHSREKLFQKYIDLFR